MLDKILTLDLPPIVMLFVYIVIPSVSALFGWVIARRKTQAETVAIEQRNEHDQENFWKNRCAELEEIIEMKDQKWAEHQEHLTNVEHYTLELKRELFDIKAIMASMRSKK